MKKPILLFIGLCLAATITAQEKPAGNGWWNNNPSLVMPIREVGVTGIRPMKEIGVQKTQLDTLVLHENIAGPRFLPWHFAVRRHRTRR